MGQKRRRLSRTAEFDRVYRHGRSVSSRHLVLYVFPREESHGQPKSDGRELESDAQSRLGVSVGRRVGGAVVRNRVKRLLREAFWSLEGLFDDTSDYVIVARTDVGSLVEKEGLEGLRRDLRELVEKLAPDPGRSQRTGSQDAVA